MPRAGINDNRNSNAPKQKCPKPETSATTLMGVASFIDSVPKRKLAVAGRIPWRKFLITKAQTLEIISIVRAETHFLDLAIFSFIALFSEKIGKFIFERFTKSLRKKQVEYEESGTFHITDNLSQAAILALICYLFDVVEIVFEVVGIKNTKRDFSTIIAKLMYATWAALRVRAYKRDFFEASFSVANRWSKRKGSQANVEIFDKITDFFVFAILALMWTDILNIKRSNSLSSIFALGGAGTLIFTLACQDLAKRMLSGLSITTTDMFAVGDLIRLEGGMSGTVKSIGWLSTEIRGSDEIVTKIPNSQLSNIRVSNISRVKLSQVTQTLRFKYQDLNKIPSVVKEIRSEIASSCPKVIRDGSRPFRVKWVDYGTDYIEVIVDCRLRNPPIGDGYFEIRQEILEAIARAVEREGVRFIVPSELNIEFAKDNPLEDAAIEHQES